MEIIISANSENFKTSLCDYDCSDCNDCGSDCSDCNDCSDCVCDGNYYHGDDCMIGA